MLSIILSFGVFNVSAQDAERQDCVKPRAVLFADPELDDQNTLVQLPASF